MKPLPFTFLLPLVLTSAFGNWAELNHVVEDPKIQHLQVIQGLFVGREYNRLIFSTNGEDWGKIDITPFEFIENIVWGNGIWVVNTNRGYHSDLKVYETLFSRDLKSWDYAQLPDPQSMGKVIFGSNHFWVKNLNTGEWYQSTDAVTWTLTTLPHPTWATVAPYEGRIYVADSINNISVTHDGKNWVSIIENGHILSSNKAEVLDALAGANMAFGYDSLRFGDSTITCSQNVYLSNAANQTERIDPFATIAEGEQKEGEVFIRVFKSDTMVFVATNKGRVLGSVNGRDWSMMKSSQHQVWDDDAFVCKDNRIYYTYNEDLYEIDPETKLTVQKSDSCGMGGEFNVSEEIFEYKGLFYTQYGHRILRSQNGQDWKTVFTLNTEDEALKDLHILQAQLTVSEQSLILFGLGETSTSEENVWISKGFIVTSEDGEQWTLTETVTEAGENFAFQNVYPDRHYDPIWISVKRGSDKWVVANTGNVFYSADGIRWNTATQPADMRIDTVYFDGIQFVGAGGKHFFHSNDGTEWTVSQEANSSTGATRFNFTKITQQAGKYFALADSVFFDSQDGKTWTEIETPPHGATYLPPNPNLFDFHGKLYLRYWGTTYRYEEPNRWEADDSLPDPQSLFLVPDSQKYVLKRRNHTGLWVESHQLHKTEVKIEELSWSISEGDDTTSVFQVTRYRDIDQPLEVHLRLWGSATVWVDYAPNVETSEGRAVLHFPAGFSALNIDVTAHLDELAEGYEMITATVLESDDYDRIEGKTVADVSLRD